MAKWQARDDFKKVNRILDILTLLYVIGVVIAIIFLWTKAPDTIPTHYGFNGQVDAYGSKNTVFILLGLLVGLYIIIRITSNYPNVFNYPIPITDLNREKQYNLAATFMRVLNFEVVCVFFYLSMQSLLGNTKLSSLGTWGFLVIIIVTIGVQIFVSLKNK